MASMIPTTPKAGRTGGGFTRKLLFPTAASSQPMPHQNNSVDTLSLHSDDSGKSNSTISGFVQRIGRTVSFSNGSNKAGADKQPARSIEGYDPSKEPIKVTSSPYTRAKS